MDLLNLPIMSSMARRCLNTTKAINSDLFFERKGPKTPATSPKGSVNDNTRRTSSGVESEINEELKEELIED